MIFVEILVVLFLIASVPDKKSEPVKPVELPASSIGAYEAPVDTGTYQVAIGTCSPAPYLWVSSTTPYAEGVIIKRMNK